MYGQVSPFSKSGCTTIPLQKLSLVAVVRRLWKVRRSHVLCRQTYGLVPCPVETIGDDLELVCREGMCGELVRDLSVRYTIIYVL